MATGLNALKPAAGATKKRKRIGRGNASGHGSYSTKGQKGQNARAGVSDLHKLGMRQVLLKTPKLRGFKSLQAKDQVINLDDLDLFYKDGETVDCKSLYKYKLIAKINGGVKILGEGELHRNGLNFVGVKFSKSAKEKIMGKGGKIA
jgi:large subunit ribosomal protein L15